jgi:hypothetical protein
LSDDLGHGQRPDLTRGVIGQLLQFVFQISHLNAS